MFFEILYTIFDYLIFKYTKRVPPCMEYEFRMSDEDYDRLFKKSESDFVGIPLNTNKISEEDMEKQDIQDMNLTC